MDRITFCDVVPHVFSNMTHIVSDVWNKEATFEKGKIYLIEADSGRGKSTLCSYVAGFRHDYEGKILFDSNDIAAIKRSRWKYLRRHCVSLLFQELRLFPEFTAMENVEIKNNLTSFKSRKKIEEWFSILGIADKMDTRLSLLSFGQQQRIAMMRSLAQPFDFILADEPISHLDDSNAAVMAELMLSEARHQGAGVIVTSIGKHMSLEYDKIYKL